MFHSLRRNLCAVFITCVGLPGIFLPHACFAAVAAPAKHNAIGIVGEQNQYVLNLTPTDRTDGTSVRYHPNILVTAGFQATISDLTLEYKTAGGRSESDDAKKGVTSYDDIRLGITLGSKDQWLVSTYYTRYAGLYIENSSDVDPAYVGVDSYIQRGDISIFNYGFSAVYVWNPEQFSLAAALSQSARQTESGGSLLLMMALDGSQIYANSSLIPATKQSLFGQDADLTTTRFSTASAAVGYGYTLTGGSLYLTAVGLIGPGHQWRDYTSSGVAVSSNANASKSFIALSLGYNGDSLYTALVFTDTQTENATQSVRFRPEFQQLRWVLGVRF